MTPVQFDPLVTVFGLLDRWRHFPAYRLARRADVFFVRYLREVLEGETGVQLLETIIPELPLSVGGADGLIGFETFAGYVDRHTDPLSLLFARYLRRWTAPSGSTPPE